MVRIGNDCSWVGRIPGHQTRHGPNQSISLCCASTDVDKLRSTGEQTPNRVKRSLTFLDNPRSPPGPIYRGLLRAISRLPSAHPPVLYARNLDLRVEAC